MIRRVDIIFAAVLLALFAGSPVAEGQTAITPLFPCSPTITDGNGIRTELARRSGDFECREDVLKKIDACGANTLEIPMGWDILVRNGEVMTDIFDSAMESLRNYPFYGVGCLSSARDGSLNLFSDTEKYLDYVRNVAFRYKFYLGAIVTPAGMDSFRSGGKPVDAAGYLEILKSVYSTVKSVAPRMSVVFGPMTNLKSDFSSELMEKGAASCFDIYCVNGSGRPESLSSKMKSLRRKMDEYGFEKPVWVTASYSTFKNNGDDAETEQAVRIARTYLMAYALGAEKVFWNGFRSMEVNPTFAPHFTGLVHNSMIPKPGFKAVQAFFAALPSGSTRPVISFLDDVFLATWTRPDGETVNAVWYTGEGEAASNIQIVGKPRFVDMLGSRMKIKDLDIITRGVTYIYGAKEVRFK